MNLKKNYIPVIVIPCLFLLAWILVIELTQQRIQYEGKSKINTLNLKVTPYIWDFKRFKNDIVTPFQKYWKIQNNNIIHAAKGSNPKLSLNFSGEKINTQQASELHISSAKNLGGTLKLQIKVSLQDQVFYYTNLIRLSGTRQVINLQQQWFGLNKDGIQFDDFEWPGTKNYISSLVLEFTNPEDSLSIQAVSLPLNSMIEEKNFIPIDCQGNYDKSVNLMASSINVFTINNYCWLPSSYMSLKDFVDRNIPGSVLILEDKQLIMKPSLHKINSNYSHSFSIVIVLYTFVAVFLVLIFYLAFLNKQNAPVFMRDKQYGWLTAYTVIMGISSLLFLLMVWFRAPDFLTFKFFPMYFLWAILQQVILCVLLADKIFFKQTQNKFLSSLFAASIFSILHLPSMSFVLATFIGGFLWSYSWLHYKRIIPLALSHTILALMLYHVIPEKILYSARVLHWFWE